MTRGQSIPLKSFPSRLPSWAAGWLAGLAILVGSSLGPAPVRAFEPLDRWQPVGPSSALETARTSRSPVEIGLPLAFHMRLRTSRVWGLVAPDAIDSRQLAGFQSSLSFDPNLNSLHPRDLALEGHLQIMRSLGHGLEMGMAWSSRSALSSGVGIELDRHFIGCVFRLVR